MDRYVNVPLSEKDAHSLKAGDYVYLTGTIYKGQVVEGLHPEKD